MATDEADHRTRGTVQHQPPWVRVAAGAALAAVVLYIGGWAIAGWRRPGYDPVQQAISELFELGGPTVPRALVVAGLVVSGVAFLLLAPALHRGLPGRGILGPVLVVVAGAGTLGVVAAPCTPGCPGAATSATDRWHAITAGGGYAALVLAPIAIGWRIRATLPRLSRWSIGIGGVSAILFVVHVLGLVPVAVGLQQRLFNTLADAWYVAIAIWLLTSEDPAAAR